MPNRTFERTFGEPEEGIQQKGMDQTRLQALHRPHKLRLRKKKKAGGGRLRSHKADACQPGSWRRCIAGHAAGRLIHDRTQAPGLGQITSRKPDWLSEALGQLRYGHPDDDSRASLTARLQVFVCWWKIGRNRTPRAK